MVYEGAFEVYEVHFGYVGVIWGTYRGAIGCIRV